MRDADCQLRRATESDAEFLRLLHDRAYVKYVERMGGKPEPMAADWSAVLRDDAVWLAEVDRNPTGATVLRIRPDHMLIWGVAVEPRLQRRGMGRQLMRFAEAEARRRGVDEIRLYTNRKFTENIRLYKGIGYAATHTETLGQRTLVHMRKQIRDRRDRSPGNAEEHGA